jgi:peptide chain release factor 1
MKKKITQLLARFAELEAILSHPEVFNDQKKYRALTQEHAYLSEVKGVVDEIDMRTKQLQENKEFLQSEKDPEFSVMLKEDNAQHEVRLIELQKQLENLLVPPDPNDHRNIIVEIRAGTGGDEAALFVGDCVRMYKLFADHQGWRYELLSCAESEMGGFKEYVFSMAGHNVYRLMRYEGGTHRVQRVPATEAQGRVHTSAITIAVLPEPDEETELKIDEKDLRVDTYRSSGAGGQHVNTTDSAVRLTHIPTGIVVYCQQERSQHKNKDKAMRMLQAKIIEEELLKQQAAIASDRSTQVGSGDRSERIRTYNFPQNRVTDHRINLTKHNLDQVMQGELEDFATALVAHYRQQKLEE